MKKRASYAIAVASILAITSYATIPAYATQQKDCDVKVSYSVGVVNGENICSTLNSSDLQSLLEKYGCNLDTEENTTPPTESTQPEDVTEPDSENNSGNQGTDEDSSLEETPTHPTIDTTPEDTTTPDSENNSGNQGSGNESTGTENESNISEYERKVADLVNEIRVENGISPLTLNAELSNVARIKSQDMKDNQYFSHTSPTYGSPFDMMKSFGITYKTAGENIARGQQTPEAVVDAWMNSDGHRANILNASFTEIGVGYVADGNYWTQMFIG